MKKYYINPQSGITTLGSLSAVCGMSDAGFSDPLSPAPARREPMGI